MASDSNAPRDFNWVKERSKCLLHIVFKQIEFGVGEDIKEIQSLNPTDSAKFSVITGRNQFSVSLVLDPMTALIAGEVGFQLGKDEITVKNMNGVMFKARITLNNDGECRLKIDGAEDELEQWQFRRKALERLFFGPRGPS